MPTKCPICGTYYTESENYEMVECGGEGNCPAREAGERPSNSHVLCACNRRWLSEVFLMTDQINGHGYNHCSAARKLPQKQHKPSTEENMVKAKKMIDELFVKLREEE